MELSEQMRNIPQVMRYYILMNNLRTMPIDSLMDHCDMFPLLSKIKKILLHNKERSYSEIDYYIIELQNKRFHFLYNIPGYESDWSTVWPEDLAKSPWNRHDMVVMLKELKDWIEQQPVYRYPAEINS